MYIQSATLQQQSNTQVLIKNEFVMMLFHELVILSDRYIRHGNIPNLSTSTIKEFQVLLLKVWQSFLSVKEWYYYLWSTMKQSSLLLDLFISLSPLSPSDFVSPLAKEWRVREIMTKEPLRGLVYFACRQRIHKQIEDSLVICHEPTPSNHSLRMTELLVSSLANHMGITKRLRESMDSAAPILTSKSDSLKAMLEAYQRQQKRNKQGLLRRFGMR